MAGTIDEAIRQVTHAESKFHEQQVPTKDLRVDGTGLFVRDRRYQLDNRGVNRLSERLRAPGPYLSSLARQISAPVLQHHLDRGDLGDGLVTLIVRDDEFVAFGRNDLTRLSGEQVLRAVGNGVGDEGSTLTIHNLGVSDEAFQLDLLSDQVAEEVEPGDVIQAGLRVGHSMIGDRATVVETYIERLVCSNGMTLRECPSRRAVRTRRLPVDHPEALRLQIEQVERLTRQVWESLRNKLQAIRSLRGEKVNVESFMERFVRHARLSVRNLMPLLLQAWDEEGGEETAYGAFNAMTRLATHNTDLSIRQRTALSRLSGLVSQHRAHICPRCFSVVSGTEAT